MNEESACPKSPRTPFSRTGHDATNGRMKHEHRITRGYIMMSKQIIKYCIGFAVFVGLMLLIQFYFSHNYDEYGVLNRQYLGDIADCQNCLIIETKDSQYSYFFGLYNKIDNSPKTYYFKNEHILRDDFLKYTGRDYYQSNPLIIKIHWNKINGWCCIRGVEIVGLLH